MNRAITIAAIALSLSQFGCERSEPDTLNDRSASSAQQTERPSTLGSAAEAAPAQIPSGPASAEHALVGERGSEAPAGSQTPQNGADTARNEPAWIVPNGWEEAENASSMRLATWVLPTESGDAECAVFRFPGGGDPRANLRRWIGQVVNDEGEPSTDIAEQGQLVVDDTPVFVVKTHGTYVTQDPPMRGPEVRLDDYALFGAVFVLPEPVFVKCVGPRGELEASETETIGFVRSFTFGASGD